MREPGAGVLSYQQYAIRIKRYGGCIRFIVLLYQKNEAPQKRGFSLLLGDAPIIIRIYFGQIYAARKFCADHFFFLRGAADPG